MQIGTKGDWTTESCTPLPTEIEVTGVSEVWDMASIMGVPVLVSSVSSVRLSERGPVPSGAVMNILWRWYGRCSILSAVVTGGTWGLP